VSLQLRALEQGKAVFGSENARLVEPLQGLGEALLEQGDAWVALATLQRAVALHAKRDPPRARPSLDLASARAVAALEKESGARGSTGRRRRTED
jgi:hypothetical protein